MVISKDKKTKTKIKIENVPGNIMLVPQLSQQEIKSLKAKAHSLKPVVRVGTKGLSDAVLEEINLALDSHELIKVKLLAEAPVRQEWYIEIADRLNACQVNLIGQVAVFYKSKQ